MRRISLTNRGRHRRSPVATLRAVPVVAQGCHQPGPRVGDAFHAPTRPGRLTAEAVASKRRADNVEGVVVAATMSPWVRQPVKDVQELHDGSGPSVRDDKG